MHNHQLSYCRDSLRIFCSQHKIMSTLLFAHLKSNNSLPFFNILFVPVNPQDSPFLWSAAFYDHFFHSACTVLCGGVNRCCCRYQVFIIMICLFKSVKKKNKINKNVHVVVWQGFVCWITCPGAFTSWSLFAKFSKTISYYQNILIYDKYTCSYIRFREENCWIKLRKTCFGF